MESRGESTSRRQREEEVQHAVEGRDVVVGRIVHRPRHQHIAGERRNQRRAMEVAKEEGKRRTGGRREEM